jgi:Glycosyltransferases involved in cell wall biogenesis
MPSPVVSVIVPVYNLEFYLERCLDSLVRQTLKDIEVIVVNDGSTDDSQIVIDEFVRRHPHLFRVFIKNNGGHGSACNLGIDRAKGEYVTFLDGDDYFDPDSIEFMYRKAVETRCDLLMANLMYRFPGGYKQPFKAVALKEEAMLSEEDRALLYRNWATPCGRLYRKTIFEDPEVRFREGIIFADANFAPKAYLAAKRIYYVDREVYHYDMTRPTQTMKQSDRRILDIVPSLIDMLEFHRGKGEFERLRPHLQAYTVMHAVGWISKVESLEGYDKLTALREIFDVPEKYFGSSWVRDEIIEKIFGKIRARRIPIDRLFNHRSVIITWKLTRYLRRLDRLIERLLLLPVSVYRRLKGWTWRAVQRIA